MATKLDVLKKAISLIKDEKTKLPLFDNAKKSDETGLIMYSFQLQKQKVITFSDATGKSTSVLRANKDKYTTLGWAVVSVLKLEAFSPAEFKEAFPSLARKYSLEKK